MTTTTFSSVYGPVTSWRYGRSLGIDPIGQVSICSFNCVYCQLGEIEKKTCDRAIYVPTEQILKDLQPFAPWDIDIITLSGSGEPTLALNLGEIIISVKQCTSRPTLVLTNGTLLGNPDVRKALALADKVSIKLDAVSPDQLQRINRPVAGMSLDSIETGIQQFRAEFSGELAIQTMVLTPWNEEIQANYIHLIQSLSPDEIQLNTPKRPKPLNRQVEGRGNHTVAQEFVYPVQVLKCVSANVIEELATLIQNATGIFVRFAA
ncbi:MAG TPA: radical SAM protein [Chroococcales cyanobacterium]|jgi:wyosine [tRNA(Phe)-imidazoG37] synthetase (radical SAM superfamily)